MDIFEMLKAKLKSKDLLLADEGGEEDDTEPAKKEEPEKKEPEKKEPENKPSFSESDIESYLKKNKSFLKKYLKDNPDDLKGFMGEAKAGSDKVQKAQEVVELHILISS